MPTPRLRADEGALATSVVAFLVAGLIFTGSIGAVLIMSKGSGGGIAASNAPSAALNGQAKSLAQFLLDSPGYSATGDDWVANGIDGSSATMPKSQGETLKRLGLKSATSSDPTMLDFSKFQNLRQAPYAANAGDGYVNYEEARQWLGLQESGLDFHIRAYPSLQKVAELLATGHRDPNLKITYLGDIDVVKTTSTGPAISPTAGLTVTDPVCIVSPLSASGTPQAYRLQTTVTNGGSVGTQFTALFTYKLGTAPSQSQNANSYVIPAHTSTTLFVDVPATSGRSCAAGSTISVQVSDPGTVAMPVRSVTLTAAVAPTPGATVAARDLWLDSARPYRLNTAGTSCANKEKSQVAYYGTNLAKNEWMALRVTTSAGAAVSIPTPSLSFQVPAGKGPWTMDLGCIPAGEYVATIYYCGASACPTPLGNDKVRVVEQLLVSATEMPAYTPDGTTTTSTSYVASAHAKAEIEYLNTLVKQFCPTYFDSRTASPIAGKDWSLPANGIDASATGDDNWATRCTFLAGQPVPRDVQPGDVFPDSKQIMNVDLPARLLREDATGTLVPDYSITNVLVAGSNLDQTAMTSQSAKGAVADWVLGGGTLIVFGSTAQNVNWLEPIFHSAIRSSSGALGTPDAGHPLLHIPDELDYPHYDNADRVWNFNGQTAQNQQNCSDPAATVACWFDNVVVEGADPVTTLSNSGAFGNGRVVLTTWMPYDLYQPDRDADTMKAEALKLINNMLMQGYQGLFLDYGPPLPANTNVVPAVRTAQVLSPDFTEPVQLQIVVFVFK
ncbi:MAG TPA: hypothetical protein VM286_06790 [Candidatus Thermoplasmatota archaeon]|nr:hypothetical protein [Candidatus Thermoplasmatota archaeon]